MTQRSNVEGRPDHSQDSDGAAPDQAPGTEAKKKGGIESAKRQAEQDWQDSAKEDGE